MPVLVGDSLDQAVPFHSGAAATVSPYLTGGIFATPGAALFGGSAVVPPIYLPHLSVAARVVHAAAALADARWQRTGAAVSLSSPLAGCASAPLPSMLVGSALAPPIFLSRLSVAARVVHAAAALAVALASRWLRSSAAPVDVRWQHVGAANLSLSSVGGCACGSRGAIAHLVLVAPLLISFWSCACRRADVSLGARGAIRRIVVVVRVPAG